MAKSNRCQGNSHVGETQESTTAMRLINNLLTFVWFDRPGESSPEKDCCW